MSSLQDHNNIKDIVCLVRDNDAAAWNDKKAKVEARTFCSAGASQRQRCPPSASVRQARMSVMARRCEGNIDAPCAFRACGEHPADPIVWDQRRTVGPYEMSFGEMRGAAHRVQRVFEHE